MSLYVGLDVGTTTVSALVVDAEGGHLVVRKTVEHLATTSSAEERARGRAELDLPKLRAVVLATLREALAPMGETTGDVVGLGVTGQMHGVVLLDRNREPLGPAITWQDRRLEDRLPGGEETYLERFSLLAGGPTAFERMGCNPSAGYLGPTLFWLRLNDQLPSGPALACFVPDAIVSCLTGCSPCSDPTNGGSSGVFDIVSRKWDFALARRLGLPEEIFPEVREPGEKVGELLPAVAEHVGLPAGTPVFVAVGDNQASFMGSVRNPMSSLLVNVGTGGQVSALVETFERLRGLDTRYYAAGRYLLVGAGSVGGRAYGYLRDFFQGVGEAFFEGGSGGELYDEMTRLAATVPAGSEGLRCSPLFTGTRMEPALRGAFTGISPSNFTLAHLTRSLLEGMAEVFHQFYDRMRSSTGDRTELVGTGNGIRRNRLLAGIMAGRFCLPLRIPVLEEAAAVGAAMLAAVGTGEFADVDAAARMLRYGDVVAPA